EQQAETDRRQRPGVEAAGEEQTTPDPAIIGKRRSLAGLGPGAAARAAFFVVDDALRRPRDGVPPGAPGRPIQLLEIEEVVFAERPDFPHELCAGEQRGTEHIRRALSRLGSDRLAFPDMADCAEPGIVPAATHRLNRARAVI